MAGLAKQMLNMRYRHAEFKLADRELWYEGIRPHGGAGDMNPLAASDSSFAFVDASGGGGSSVGVLGLAQVGKDRQQPAPVIRTGSEVRDLSYNPYVPDQLATAGADGTVRLWDLPTDGIMEADIADAVGVYDSSSIAPSPRGLCWHPAASSILAVQCLRSLAVWDVQNPTAPALVVGAAAMDTGPEGNLCSLTWSYVGDVLCTTDKGRRLRLVDPRAGVAVAEAVAVHGGGATRTVWCLGSGTAEGGGHILSTGVSATTREREMALWDCRALQRPLKRERLGGSSSGFVLPLLDVASGLLLLCGRGDTNVRAYEWDAGAAAPLPVANTVAVGGVARGYALVPRASLDMMCCEIARLLRLVDGAVLPVRIEVPRRDKRAFHAELFPPAAGPYPALTGEDWLADTTLPPYLVQADPEAAAARQPRVGGVVAAAASVAAVSTAAISAEELRAAAEGTTAAAATGDVASAAAAAPAEEPGGADAAEALKLGAFAGGGGMQRFRHVFGTETPGRRPTYNFSPLLTNLDEPGVACSDHFWAVPCAGGGGPVFVSPMESHGKVEVGRPMINGHKSSVTSIAFGRFDPALMATGADDGSLALWQLPEGGPTAAMGADDAVALVSGNDAPVRHVEWHPGAADLLMCTASDNTVRLFDVNSSGGGGGGSGGAAAVVLRCHPQAIHCAAFSGDGALIATTCHDGLLRVLDPRTGDAVSQVAAHEGSRAQRVAWWFGARAPPLELLVTTGGGRQAQRQLGLWDPRRMTMPLSMTNVDYSNGLLFPLLAEATGILFLAGRGDTGIRFFELEVLSGRAAPAGGSANGSGSDGGGGGGGGDEALDMRLAYCSDHKCGAEPMWGVALLPQTPGSLDVAGVEVARMLRLTASAAEPLSFFLPRSNNLKPFFQDDIYSDVCGPTLAGSAADWLGGAPCHPVKASLRPAGMPLVSERPAQEHLVPQSRKFRGEMEKREQDAKARADELARLSALANQTAAFHPNLSMGVRRGVDQAPVLDDNEADWSD